MRNAEGIARAVKHSDRNTDPVPTGKGGARTLRLKEVERALAASLIETRNHLTHFEPPNEWVADTSYGYAVLAAALEFVLEANILLDLGLTEAEVQDSLAQGHGWDDPIQVLPADEAPGRTRDDS